MNLEEEQLVYEYINEYLNDKKFNDFYINNLSFYNEYFKVIVEYHYYNGSDVINISDNDFFNWYKRKIRKEKIKKLNV